MIFLFLIMNSQRFLRVLLQHQGGQEYLLAAPSYSTSTYCTYQVSMMSENILLQQSSFLYTARVTHCTSRAIFLSGCKIYASICVKDIANSKKLECFRSRFSSKMIKRNTDWPNGSFYVNQKIRWSGYREFRHSEQMPTKQMVIQTFN